MMPKPPNSANSRSRSGAKRGNWSQRGATATERYIGEKGRGTHRPTTQAHRHRRDQGIGQVSTDRRRPARPTTAVRPATPGKKEAGRKPTVDRPRPTGPVDIDKPADPSKKP